MDENPKPEENPEDFLSPPKDSGGILPPDFEPLPMPPARKNPLDKIKNLFGKIPDLIQGLLAKLPKNLPRKFLKKSEGAEEMPPQSSEPSQQLPPESAFQIEPPAENEELDPFDKLGAKLPEPLRPIFARYGRLIAGALILFVLILGVKSCFFGKKKSPKLSLEGMVSEEKKSQDGPIPVKGFKVGRFNFEDSLNALGTIKGSVEFKLSFEVPGTISSINYREGERYEEGALLISLRQDDILLRLKKSQADLNRYQTQAAIVDKKVKEHEKLFEMGAIPKTTLENVKLELESSQYEAEAARLEVKAAESMLEKSNLYAPSAGMIGELSIEEGEAITANTLLGSHINTEFVYAEFGIVERDVNKIALGQKARVFVDAYPDKTFEGVIENISPVVAGTSRTATAKVRIENPERLLLPGMFCRIRILLYSKKNTLVVPTDAIQGGQGEQFIYVAHLDQPLAPEGAEKTVAPESEKSAKASKGEEGASKKSSPKNLGVIEKRAITVGYTRPDYSQIDAGISEGELVAISGLERLEDKKKIRLLETQEAEV